MEMASETREDRGRSLNLDMLRDPRALIAAAFVAGLVIGLVVLGWQVWPVEWENATPQELSPAYQEDYMRMVIDSHNLRQDESAAAQRIDALGDRAEDALAAVAAAPGDQSAEAIAQFQAELGVAPIPDVANTAEDPPEEAASPLISGNILLTICGIAGVLALALGGIYFIRRRQNDGERPAALRAQDLTKDAPHTDFRAMGESQPLSQWMTTYLVGDDLFDDSFSIDSVEGEFLGECGVGIAETIGVGNPKRVSAFEIWLFDKNDIQTVTKVLMSNHVFRDDSARERLSAKGEPVLASPGMEAVLETETLQLIARVVDMNYGEGALPEDSFFERVTLELAVWSKV
jgi:hypothetical protein